MSNGRDPQRSLLHCIIRGRWSGTERREEQDGHKRVETVEGHRWSERREEKPDLLLLGLFIC